MAKLLLTNFSMQPEPSSTTTHTSAPGDAGAAHGQAPSSPGSQIQLFLPLVLFMLVFYFLMLRPQQKQRKELDAMLKALKKGDQVRTSGGIRGEITDLGDTEVTLLVADKVKINVLRSNIASKADAAHAAKNKS